MKVIRVDERGRSEAKGMGLVRPLAEQGRVDKRFNIFDISNLGLENVFKQLYHHSFTPLLCIFKVFSLTAMNCLLFRSMRICIASKGQ